MSTLKVTNQIWSEKVPYLDLKTVIPKEGRIDILKIDIEGSEFDLLENFPEVFQRARLLVMELHGQEARASEFERRLRTLGLQRMLATNCEGKREVDSLCA